jgi:Ca2+-binding RTX toxin-like protein
MKTLFDSLCRFGSRFKASPPPFRPVRPAFDVLEARHVPSGVTLDASGVLTMTGGDTADTFVLKFVANDLGNGVFSFLYRVRWEHDGLPVQKFNFLPPAVKSYWLLGNGGSDTFTNETFLAGVAEGHAGNDTLSGGKGSDTLKGGQDADWLQGGEGNDSLLGQGGKDVLFGSYLWINGGPANPGNDILDGGGGHDQLIGDVGDDSLYGSGGNDTLMGLGGADVLVGGDGDDELRGGDGVDQLYGGSGVDRLWGGSDHDELSGGPNDDSLFGEGQDDWLLGEDGNDYLDGGEGSDKLWGGEDDDVLIGGPGADTLSGEGGDDHLYNKRRLDPLADVWPDAFDGGDGYDWLHDLGSNDLLPVGVEKIEWA